MKIPYVHRRTKDRYKRCLNIEFREIFGEVSEKFWNSIGRFADFVYKKNRGDKKMIYDLCTGVDSIHTLYDYKEALGRRMDSTTRLWEGLW